MNCNVGLELNKVYCMDCLEGMKQIKDNSIDLIVTSPPYNAGIEYADYDDKKEWSEYYKWTNEWLEGVFKILKPDGRICINHFLNYGDKDNRQSPIMEINRIAQEIGFKHHGVALWTDNNITKRTAWGSWLSASAPYINLSTEAILIMYKQSWKKLDKGNSDIDKQEFMEATSGQWKIQPETKQLTKACFPLELPKRCIKLLSYTTDIMLDPFLGSGTTAVAAKQLGRQYIGFEISPEYCKIAEQRLKQEVLKEWF